ncbi:MAG: hypothetical protein ACI83D_000185 [Planctomycetota bacterium]|jgi:hypothetical protein
MDIVKVTGEKEPFSSNKLCQSISNAGAPPEMADTICRAIAERIEPGATTTKIWRMALGYLIKEDLRLGADYSLRRGLADLGPSGFLFEQFVEALLQAYNFDTERNVMMTGISGVVHEIDVVARQGSQHALIEAKYKNQYGLKTSVDVIMYAGARLDDVHAYQLKHEKGGGDNSHEMWVVTNTKFTKSSIKYAQHKNITLIGWNYPREGNLADLISGKRMYPITVLPSLSSDEREKFTKKGIILVRDLLPYDPQYIASEFGIPPEIARIIVEEAYVLVKGGNPLVVK